MDDINDLKQILKEVIAEFLIENHADAAPFLKGLEKYLLWIDKTGRGEKPIRLTKSHILKTWDLTEPDWTTDQTLKEYLDACYIGDIWETREQRLKCIGIY